MVQPRSVLPLLLLLLLAVTEAHIPRVCTTQQYRSLKRCCPDFEGSPCGLAQGRGECTVFDAPFKIWPPPLYNEYCKCKGNFDTFDCSRCKPGFTGTNCTERQHYVRKEITSLTEKEKKRLYDSLQKAKHKHSERYVIVTREFNDTDLVFENATVYDLFVWMHYFAGRAAAVGGKNAAHQGPTFPFWHRYYLLFMEREIRDLTGDEDFFIPYWDWTKTNHCNICTNDLMGDSPGGNISQESGFSRWQTVCTYDDEITSHAGYRKICAKPENDADIKYIQRSPGKNSESNALPTAEEVKMVLATEEYDTPPYNRRSENSFRNRLEGFDLSVNSKNLSDAMHNLVHDYLNGTVSQVPIAANDPIFMLHHAMIDKIFEEWLLKHPNMTYPISEEITPIQRADSLMRPFFPPVRNDHLVGYTAEELGYKYE